MDAVKFVTVIDAQGIGRFAKSKCKQTMTIAWLGYERNILGFHIQDHFRGLFLPLWGRAGETGVRKADAGEERVGGEPLLSFRYIPAS